MADKEYQIDNNINIKKETDAQQCPSPCFVDLQKTKYSFLQAIKYLYKISDIFIIAYTDTHVQACLCIGTKLSNKNRTYI